jgi:UDP-glucose 4-epimerase
VPDFTWVVGSGGLLGQSAETAIGATPGDLWRAPRRVSWSASDGGREDLRELVQQFLNDAEDRPWSVWWCAGAGTVTTPEATLQLELQALHATLEQLGASASARRGAFFFASSAGGAYAGVGAPPYDEFSPVRPLGAYGRAKLDAEALVTEWSERSGTPALIGRIANIYGPGQNVNKAQGLISQICRSHLFGTPLSIYVPLDTLRDYLFAPDCAQLIRDAMSRLRREHATTGATVVTKVIASQRAITVGAVLGEMRRIFKSPPRIVVGSSTVSQFQARDLSLRSRVWADVDRRTLTPFPVGVAVTSADLLRRLQGAQLVSSLP